MALTFAQLEALIAVQKQTWTCVDSDLGRSVAAGEFSGLGLSIGSGRDKSIITEGVLSSSGLLAKNIPSKIDWRNQDNKTWVSPVKNQLQCGSCVAFAVLAATEARYRIRRKSPSDPIDLSEADLFFNGRGSCAKGWQISKAFGRLAEYGVGQESDFPYQPEQMSGRKIPAVVKTPAPETTVDDALCKQWLAARGPVVSGLRVHADFGYYKSGVYRPAVSTVRGDHAVAIVGYDDELAAWIIQNSWGETWGEGGFGYLGYGVCGLGTVYPFYEAGVETVAPQPRARANRRTGTRG
jgi:C1A family cysteine protease